MSDQQSNQVTIGGRQFVASCITLGIMRRHSGALKTVMGMKISATTGSLPSPDEYQAVIDIVGAGLTAVEPLPLPPANTKGTAFEHFVDGLNFRTAIMELMVALKAIMTASGYNANAEEGSESGEQATAAPLT